MPTCASCGQENPEIARFCLACAAPLEEEAPEEVRKVVTIVFSDLRGSTEQGADGERRESPRSSLPN